MEFDIKPATVGYQEIIVQLTDTAVNFGSGLIEVFATPAMIGLMEKTAQLSIQEQLTQGYITLGTEINVKHVKATPVGMKVYCNSELLSVDGKRLVFKISARDEAGLIGEGTHHRYIVEADRFMEKLNQSAKLHL